MISVAFAAVLWLARAQLTTAIRDLRHLFSPAGEWIERRRDGRVQRRPAGRVKEIRIDPSNVEQIRVTVEIETTLLSSRTGRQP